MTDVRRFDFLEKVVADERRRLDDFISTMLARHGAHGHTGTDHGSLAGLGDNDHPQYSLSGHTHSEYLLDTNPVFAGKCTTALSVPNGFTAVTLGSEDFDSESGHSTVTNTSRYTIQLAGYYLISGVINHASTTGNWAACIFKNGAMIPGGANFGLGNSIFRIPTPTRLLSLAVNDYIELRNYQDSGVTKTLELVDGTSAHLDIFFVRPP